MSGSVERIMSEVFTAVSLVVGFTSFIRGSLETRLPADMPLLRLLQGQEDVDIKTMTRSGGTCECVLSFSIDIYALKGSQNFETVLNLLRRNVVIQLVLIDSFFIVYEEAASAPEIENDDGDVMASMRLSFRAEYDRPYNDPT